MVTIQVEVEHLQSGAFNFCIFDLGEIMVDRSSIARLVLGGPGDGTASVYYCDRLGSDKLGVIILFENLQSHGSPVAWRRSHLQRYPLIPIGEELIGFVSSYPPNGCGLDLLERGPGSEVATVE